MLVHISGVSRSDAISRHRDSIEYATFHMMVRRGECFDNMATIISESCLELEDNDGFDALTLPRVNCPDAAAWRAVASVVTFGMMIWRDG